MQNLGNPIITMYAQSDCDEINRIHTLYFEYVDECDNE